MSAGAFTQAKYEADAGDVFKGRVQPETLAMSIASTPNSNASGAIDAPVGIKFTSSVGETGVRPRRIGIKFTGSVPTDYVAGQIYYIPVMTPTAYAAYTIGATGTYLDEAVEVVSRIGEASN